MHCCSARTPSLVLCRADEGNSVLRVKGAVVVMPGSNSSAGVGASHRPRLLWIPRVQRPPPLNPGDCSGRGKMPARAAESSPSATQQCSCRLCLPLSPSAHSPCAESPARAHRVATSSLSQVDLRKACWKRHSFAALLLQVKPVVNPLQPALVKFLPEVRADPDFALRPTRPSNFWRHSVNPPPYRSRKSRADGGTGEEAAIHPPPAASHRHTHLLGGSNVCYSDPATALRGHSSLCTPAAPCTRGGR